MKALDRGRRKRTDRSGFTLVELMIVVVIMVILAAAAVPVFTGYAKRAKDSKAIAECRLAVQAAQVKAGDLYAAGKLEITSTNNTISDHNDEIIALANVNGKILQGPTVDESSQVVFVLYECENGTQVRYDFTKNPKYAVMTEDAPLTVIENWAKDSSDWITEYAKNNTLNGVSRDTIADKMLKATNGQFLPVDDDIKKGTIYEKQDLTWRPYYLQTADGSYKVFLYASDNPKTSAGWAAKLIYIDGKIYVSDKPGGSGFASIYTKNYEEAEEYITDVMKLNRK